MLDLLTNVKFMVTLTYGVFSVLVYTIVTLVLVTGKKTFNGSFFRIFISGYFMNLWTYGNSFITLRLPQNTQLNGTFASFFLDHGPDNVEKNHFPLNFFYMMHFHFAYCQYLFNFLTSFNRATAIYMPLKFEQIWKKAIYPAFIIIYILPFVFSNPILRNNAYYTYNPSSDYFVTVTEYGRANIYSSLMPVLITCTVSNIVVNIAALNKFIRRNRSGNNVIESNLFFMSLCIFFIDLTLSLLSIFNYMSSNKMNWLLVIFNESQISSLSYVTQILTPFASDLLTFSHAWLMLIFSKSVRTSVFRAIGLSKLMKKVQLKLNVFHPSSNSSVVIIEGGAAGLEGHRNAGSAAVLAQNAAASQARNSVAVAIGGGGSSAPNSRAGAAGGAIKNRPTYASLQVLK